MTKLKKAFKVMQLVFSLLLLAYLARRYHYSLSSLNFSLAGSAWLLPCVFIALVLIPVLAGYRWKVMLQALKQHYPVGALIRINFLSIFWGIFLPSADGFAVIRAMMLMQKAPRKQALGSVILEKFTGIVCLFVLALISSLWLAATGPVQALRLILALSLIVLVVIMASVRKINKTTAKSTTFVGKLVGKLRSLAIVLANSDKKKLMAGAVPVVAVQVLSILNIHFLFKFMGYQVPFVTQLCFVPVIQTITLLPLTISGFGVREGAFIYFYQPLGILPDDLITISVLNFLLLTGLPALVGGVLSFYSNIKKQDLSWGNLNPNGTEV